MSHNNDFSQTQDDGITNIITATPEITVEEGASLAAIATTLTEELESLPNPGAAAEFAKVR